MKTKKESNLLFYAIMVIALSMILLAFNRTVRRLEDKVAEIHLIINESDKCRD